MKGIFELFELTRTPRNGWKRIGIKNAEYVAEHVAIAPQIGYILAVMEGEDPEPVACMLMVHDNGETRTNDPDRIMKIYFPNKNEAEMQAFCDQLDLLSVVRERWMNYFTEFDKGKTKRAIIAKDADLLQMAFKAKHLVETGYVAAQKWIDAVEGALVTDSAKSIFEEMTKNNFYCWWEDL